MEVVLAQGDQAAAPGSSVALTLTPGAGSPGLQLLRECQTGAQVKRRLVVSNSKIRRERKEAARVHGLPGKPDPTGSRRDRRHPQPEKKA